MLMTAIISTILAATTALTPEPGISYGVSGSFGGMMGNTPVYAGGCNFPFDDPISVPASSKTFYQGIYNALTHERIGNLPVKTAYGASAQTSRGLVMAGGSTADCWLLSAESELSALPSLPATVDNAYACAINDTVYIAGGNYDGQASNRLLALNITAPDSGWIELAPMPGLPRVQPVMAASNGKLYVWGGFFNSPDVKEVHTEGLCYDPASNAWSALPAPAPGVTLSGGSAATLADGRIVACGGVNRQIFLDAITCQAADYLLHPAEWYQFNPNLYIFHPATLAWTALARPELARAGAAVAVSPEGVLLMGGELKPRVRTPRTVIIL